MHEFTLAVNILDLCTDALKEHNAQKVTELVLEIGTLSGVEPSALETALESIKPHTILESAEIKFTICNALVSCRNCNAEFEPKDQFSPCPVCDNYGIKILAGQELFIKSITLE
jgi:hydrogenase nickel incorporation protein HypA/HybF